MKIQDILTDESKWCKNSFSIGYGGSDVPIKIAFCLVGAMYRAYRDENERDAVVLKIETRVRGSATEWNDEPDRTFKQVRALIEELDI